MPTPLFSATKWPTRTAGALALVANPNDQARLLVVTVRLSAVPTTSENLTVAWHHGGTAGAYSVELVREDLATEAVQNVVYLPESELVIDVGDTIEIAYANSDGNTIAVMIMMEVGR